MAAAPLTSNHVNYLIWRYLQESGHDRTAARLQRDWKIGDPESLPFAPHIKTHALVSLVQKGLQYHELENSLQQNGERTPQTPTALFFGTESADAPSRDDDAVSNLKAPASPSKRGRESLPSSAAQEAAVSAPASKRRRGAKDAATRTTPAKSSDEMDVDVPPVTDTDAANVPPSTDGHSADSGYVNGTREDAAHVDRGISADGASAAVGVAVEPPAAPEPVVPTLETGRSVVTQTDAIVQIGASTTRLIELGAGKHTLKTVWNPQQPDLLAAAGDGLCRIWSVPSGNAGGPDAATPVNNASATDSSSATFAPQYIKLFEGVGQGMEKATITAIAWTPDGGYLAAARTPDDLKEASAITIFDNKGREITQLGRGQRFFLGLSFNPSGTLLLGHGADNSHYSDQSRDYGICVWNFASDNPEVMPSTSTARRQVVDGAIWLDDSRIMVCGQGYVATTSYRNDALQPLQDLNLDAARGPDMERPRQWTFMEHDRYTDTCILADEDQGFLGLLSKDHKSFAVVKAHEEEIRGIQYQPLPQHGSTGEGTRLLATASKDGSIKLWDAANDKLELKLALHCNSLNPTQQPALAMQFSPDGGSLAVATTSKVSFWRLEKLGAWPYAEWSLERAETGWRDGSPVVKHEHDGEGLVNGTGAASTNGINGHVQSNGTNGGSPMEQGLGVDGATQMQIDAPDVRPSRGNADYANFTQTLAWSAMGKRIAYGSGEQIAIADFVNVTRP